MANMDPSQDLHINRPKSPYRQRLDQEGLPVHTGFFIEDLRTLDVKPWPRMGALGAYVLLEGSEERDDAYVLEIPPGQSTKSERHLYEELIFVLTGRGATTVWVEGEKKQTLEWHAGALFSPPLNAWHQHFNGSGSEPARFVAVTTAPVMINLLHDPDFIFNNNHVFRDRYAGEDNYFDGVGRSIGTRLWETNLVPDVGTFKLQEYKERGKGNSYMRFEMSNNSMLAHVSEFPVGSYKKAHRHTAGAHVIIVSGQGYSLMWLEGTEPKKFDWHEGSVIVPPDRWFHQHFNTGTTPARYLALRWGSVKNPIVTQIKRDVERVRKEDQIEYEDQDAAIHRLFESECARFGAQVSMKIS